MTVQVCMNETLVEAFKYTEDTVVDRKLDKKLHTVSFYFHVPSEAYHDVTTLLYENNFTIKVPERNVSFQATIATYSTSITNLYNENEVGTFYLQLIEKP
ncbi:MAG TPA: DUF3219 family protein [Bacillota bacterium]